jgi:cytochrome c-type biogenesis protein CcmH/NrfF
LALASNRPVHGLLNLIQLVTCFSPSSFGKSAQVIEGAATKRYGFMVSYHAPDNTKFCIGWAGVSSIKLRF